MRHSIWRSVVALTAALVALAAGLPAPLAGAALIAGITEDDIATTAVTDVQSTFKRVYAMAADLIPDATALTAQFKRTKKMRPAGDGTFYFNVKLETGGATANVGDGQLLPRATRPKRKQGRTGIAHTYTVVAIGGQSIPLTENSKGAFVSNLEDQLEDGMTRVKNDVERQNNGDGDGILCLVETIAGAPTYGVEKPYGKTNGGPGTMLLIEDMDVAAINPADGTERGRSKITDVDIDNDEFTAAATLNAVIGDYIVLCNDSALTAAADKVTNYEAEASGILAATASGDTFEEIDGSAYKRWNGIVMGNSGTARPISEKLVAQLVARIRARSGKKPTLFYTTRGITIEMMDQLGGLRRIDGVTKKIKGGYEALELNGRTVVEGDWCAKGTFFALNPTPDCVATADLAKMGYIDLDGAKLHRISGRHAYRADLWFPHNILWFARSAHGRLDDLEDDDSIVR